MQVETIVHTTSECIISIIANETIYSCKGLYSQCLSCEAGLIAYLSAATSLPNFIKRSLCYSFSTKKELYPIYEVGLLQKTHVDAIPCDVPVFEQQPNKHYVKTHIS